MSVIKFPLLPDEKDPIYFNRNPLPGCVFFIEIMSLEDGSALAFGPIDCSISTAEDLLHFSIGNWQRTDQIEVPEKWWIKNKKRYTKLLVRKDLSWGKFGNFHSDLIFLLRAQLSRAENASDPILAEILGDEKFQDEFQKMKGRIMQKKKDEITKMREPKSNIPPNDTRNFIIILLVSFAFIALLVGG
jgi:hypothetical protein